MMYKRLLALMQSSSGKMLRIVVALCFVGAVLSGPPVSRSREEIQEFRDFLESTRTDRGVILSSTNPEEPEGNVWEKSGKYQGDILLDDEQVESMVEQFSQGRNAYIWPNTQWPGRVVVYEFAHGHFDNAQRNQILYAMSVLQDRTCIRFRPRHHNEANYVLITGHPGCYASVGYWATRGVHTMNVARDVPGRGCLNTIYIIHEWLHVIGFFHMQSTYNRYDFVRINWANIVRGMEHNFDRLGNNLVSNLGLPYEYDSCMHYGAFFFSSNGRTTMDAIRPHPNGMGHLRYVTGYDFYRVDRLYGCYPWRESKDYQHFYANETVPFVNEHDIISKPLVSEDIISNE